MTKNHKGVHCARVYFHHEILSNELLFFLDPRVCHRLQNVVSDALNRNIRSLRRWSPHCSLLLVPNACQPRTTILEGQSHLIQILFVWNVERPLAFSSCARVSRPSLDKWHGFSTICRPFCPVIHTLHVCSYHAQLEHRRSFFVCLRRCLAASSRLASCAILCFWGTSYAGQPWAFGCIGNPR